MRRGLAIIATAAVAGTALAAAVTLPALVTLGPNTAPESLPLAVGKPSNVVVHAAPLPPPKAPAKHGRKSKRPRDELRHLHSSSLPAKLSEIADPRISG